MLVATEAAVCFAATTMLHWADDCGPVLAVFAFGAAAVGWAWKSFRYGGVVEEGSGHRKPAKGLVKVIGEAAKTRVWR